MTALSPAPPREASYIMFEALSRIVESGEANPQAVGIAQTAIRNALDADTTAASPSGPAQADLDEKALEAAWGAYSYPDDGATVGEEIEAMAHAIRAYLAAAVRTQEGPDLLRLSSDGVERTVLLEAMDLYDQHHGDEDHPDHVARLWAVLRGAEGEKE